MMVSKVALKSFSMTVLV